MCGIAGATHTDTDLARVAVEAMCQQMIARGPDDMGVETFDARGSFFALGNTRLAIIDPSPAGHQPLCDERGNAIVFNGMIYNYRELRREMIASGERFCSDTDTEVVLRAYGRWGAACVERLRGMFAFGIWDARTRELLLARDRLGIKPLYYWQRGRDFAFASQVKALLRSGRVPPRLDADGIRSFLAFGAVIEPLTAIAGVRALPAGHVATLGDGRMTETPYWRMPEASRGNLTPADAAHELRGLLEDSVSRHLVSDAPIGVFLSGGLDSSALAALAARDGRRVSTVSVVFDEARYSEQPYSDLVAHHIGSDHLRVVTRREELPELLDGAFDAMDQPSFDGLNTFAVSRAAARAGLKVALSGLGSDELFDGYGHTRRVRALENIASAPWVLTRAAGFAASAVANGGRWEKASAWLSDGAGGLSAHDLVRSLFLPAEVDLLTGALPPVSHDEQLSSARGHSYVSASDLRLYTKNVLLRDTDAMSMAHSIEVRVPYLDDAVVDWGLRLPLSARTGGPKALLVEATRDLLPPEIASRKKQGFLLPLAQWLRQDADSVDRAMDGVGADLAEIVDLIEMRAIWAQFQRDGRRWLRSWALYSLCRWTASLGVAQKAAA